MNLGGDSVVEFNELLVSVKNPLERFVYFKIPNKMSSEDIIQETYLTAFKNFEKLKDKSSFKAWILSIARNKCNDYFRNEAKNLEISIDNICEKELSYTRQGIAEISVVKETLELIGNKEKQILYLSYFKDMPQSEIAKLLNIPIGTVKSRLHNAKIKFKEHYPCYQKVKGELIMKKLPEYLPEYKITKHNKEPFNVKWEELMGWFLVPKLGEKLTWGIYDIPSRKCNQIFNLEVIGKAEVHGIEGVEITAIESEYSSKNNATSRTFVAQLTDTHSRYLSSTRTENGVKKTRTFLDEDEFMQNWGYGENNCGNEVNLTQKGYIKKENNIVTSENKNYIVDIVGRYKVEINGKSFDTVCVMDIETYNTKVVTVQYLDKNGRTILWRRFNKDDWAFDRYKEKWSDKLPDNEKLMINDEIFVHWYDCITDYIL